LRHGLEIHSSEDTKQRTKVQRRQKCENPFNKANLYIIKSLNIQSACFVKNSVKSPANGIQHIEKVMHVKFFSPWNYKK
jgi:hypothetical protein